MCIRDSIEGAESDALLGATDLLGRTSHAAISCHDFIGDDRDDDSFRTLESVERILTTAGFAIARRTSDPRPWIRAVSYTHLRAHETVLDLVCRLLLEKKKKLLHILLHTYTLYIN